jgi:DNA-binding MarR family transcriptional regulator
MSRVIRSLEHRQDPLIQCSINSRDKRKIDVLLTAHGEKTLLDYQAARVGRLVDKLRHLGDDDLEELVRVLSKVRLVLDQGNH